MVRVGTGTGQTSLVDGFFCDDCVVRDDWDERVDVVWSTAAQRSEDEVFTLILALADERPAGDPDALFERASAYDYVGREAEAEPWYRKALAAGLAGARRPRALVQLASTLRNLGRAAEGAELLRAEAVDGDELADVRAAFLALMLLDSGRPDEAVGRALLALARHLPQYRRAVTYYADELLER
jgi:tetratricopeptide (TPR) repeat protein